MKFRAVGAELLHADRQTDRHNVANSRFSTVFQTTLQSVKITLPKVYHFLHLQLYKEQSKHNCTAYSHSHVVPTTNETFVLPKYKKVYSLLIKFHTLGYQPTCFSSLRKIAKTDSEFFHLSLLLCPSVRPSVRPRGKTQFSQDGFSSNLIFDYFAKTCCGNSSYIKIGTRHNYQYTFLI
jgi:hypothetical protein